MSVAAVSHVVPPSPVHRPDAEHNAVRATKDAEAKVRNSKPHEAQASRQAPTTPSRDHRKVDVKV